MNAQPNFLPLVIAVLGGLLGLSVYRRRDFLRDQLRYVLAVVITVVVTFYVASRFTDPTKAFLVTVIVELIVLNRWRPYRSRYISRRTRRKVIARFERSGERYDPKKHEIDHVVPHSRGGTNTADNLKVIPREHNREKSAKPPWWDLLGRW